MTPAENKPTKTVSQRLRSIAFFLLRIAIASGIIAWLVSKNDEKLLDALKSINPIWLLPAILLYFSHMLAGAWRWYLLLRVQDICISFRETLSLMMQGFFFSLVIPGGALGGDFIKASLVSKNIL